MDKASFFAATSVPTDVVEIPGYGSITVSALTLKQRLRLPEQLKSDPTAATIDMVINCVEGLDEEDRYMVERMKPEVLDIFANKIMELTGLGEEDEVKKD